MAATSTIDDPDVAARQFLGLVNAELQITFMLGGTPREDEVLQSATNGVRTFLRAFGKRHAPAASKSTLRWLTHDIALAAKPPGDQILAIVLASARRWAISGLRRAQA